MKTFIRAAQKTKPDPLHYKKIADRLVPKRNELLDLACRLEEANPDDAEARKIRYRIEIDLNPRISSALRQIVCAQRMIARLKKESSIEINCIGRCWTVIQSGRLLGEFPTQQAANDFAFKGIK